eukprot:COSAG01_NODE_66328_length_270_cov_1.070175_1_plen_53_part_01
MGMGGGWPAGQPPGARRQAAEACTDSALQNRLLPACCLLSVGFSKDLITHRDP